jgi:hypothetical protein
VQLKIDARDENTAGQITSGPRDIAIDTRN